MQTRHGNRVSENIHTPYTLSRYGVSTSRQTALSYLPPLSSSFYFMLHAIILAHTSMFYEDWPVLLAISRSASRRRRGCGVLSFAHVANTCMTWYIRLISGRTRWTWDILQSWAQAPSTRNYSYLHALELKYKKEYSSLTLDTFVPFSRPGHEYRMVIPAT